MISPVASIDGLLNLPPFTVIVPPSRCKAVFLPYISAFFPIVTVPAVTSTPYGLVYSPSNPNVPRLTYAVPPVIVTEAPSSSESYFNASSKNFPPFRVKTPFEEEITPPIHWPAVVVVVPLLFSTPRIIAPFCTSSAPALTVTSCVISPPLRVNLPPDFTSTSPSTRPPYGL